MGVEDHKWNKLAQDFFQIFRMADFHIMSVETLSPATRVS
jgi:hypothetical protein